MMPAGIALVETGFYIVINIRRQILYCVIFENLMSGYNAVSLRR